MQQISSKIAIGLALTAIAAFAQTRPAFEVATIKPAVPIDPAKLIAALQAGGKLPIGATFDAHRAEYLNLDLKTLVCYAYGVKPYQISGPDWMSATHFDILGKLPEGSVKGDASKMLQSLLEERFKLTFHRASAEHAVLALVAAGKNGLKLKTSAATPVPIDEDAPLKPGEVKTEGPDGPIRTSIDFKTGSSVVDMGLKGKMAYRVDPATQSIHIDFSMMTMDGLADMLTQLFTQIGGATGGRQVVDMTGVRGNYDATIEISILDILAMAKNAGVDFGVNLPNGAGAGSGGAADPGGGSSMMDAVKSMGLKLESRKAPVDQFVVDQLEKTPTEN
jgi:uncharacterized protein (TIGR03435 family)